MSDFKYTYPDDYWDLMLPVNGSHNSFFPSVGFCFSSFAEGDLTRLSKLPEGWTTVDLRGGESFILDENKSIRAKYHLRGKVAYMHPYHRFELHKKEDEKSVTFSVLDRDVPYPQKRKEVFSKTYSVPSRTKHSDIYKRRVQQYAEQEECEKWLGKYFPSWNDYGAYWGEAVEDIVKDEK